jgi:hypothetical protein
VRHAAAAVLIAALLAAGCGDERTPAPDLAAAAPPVGWTRADYPRAGLRVSIPANWTVTSGSAPAVVTVSSGSAVVALWRYPRTEPLPRSDSDLEGARRALAGAASARDPSLAVDASHRVRIGGAPGVVIVGSEKIRGTRVRVRSTHLYAQGGELVADAYAPPGDFARIDAAVFRPLALSLRLRPAQGA